MSIFKGLNSVGNFCVWIYFKIIYLLQMMEVFDITQEKID